MLDRTLSCAPPQQFLAFSRHRMEPLAAMAPRLSPASSTPAPDWLGSAAGGLSPRKVTTLFASGFLLALGGQMVWKGLRPVVKAPVEVASQPLAAAVANHSETTLGQALKQDELNIWLLFQDQLTSLYRLALHEPEQRQTLMAYAGSGILGYLAGSLLQGTQEAWVRREETVIRSQLISNLSGVVKESIRRKLQFDNALKKEVKNRIRSLLDRHQIAPSRLEWVDRPILEPVPVAQRYFYEPTHRSVQFRGRLAGPTGNPFDPPPASPLTRWLEAGVLGVGALTGTLCYQMVSLLGKANAQMKLESAGQSVAKKVVETINVPNQEALFVLGWNRNKQILLGILGLTAAAKVGKLWIDGLREIEVTRLNAKTEYHYQANNWLVQDTKLHEIAEREVVDNELSLLEQDLPSLRDNLPALQARIQTLLGNIGRNSAPKYFPMIPPVGLREARS